MENNQLDNLVKMQSRLDEIKQELDKIKKSKEAIRKELGIVEDIRISGNSDYTTLRIQSETLKEERRLLNTELNKKEYVKKIKASSLDSDQIYNYIIIALIILIILLIIWLLIIMVT